MNSIPEDIFLVIFQYLDLKSLISFSETSKNHLALVQNPAIWANRKPSTRPALALGALFHYDISLWKSSLHTAESFPLDLPSYKSVLSKIDSARLVLKPSIESKMNFSLSGMVKYEDELFWNSKQRDSMNYDESFICELIDSCFVFTFSFKVYRALCQGGIIYPPQSIRISIGNAPNEFHWVSETYKVPISEKLATIQILPEIVIGKYVKVELIGLLTQMPNSEFFITALEFIEIGGNTVNDGKISNLEKAIFDGNLDVACDVLDRNKHKASPFVIDLIQRKGLLFEYLGRINRGLNEAESFVYAKSLLDSNTFPKSLDWFENVKCSEALGDLLFEARAFYPAFLVYRRNKDIWKLSKTAIVLRQTQLLKQILSMREPRYPMYSDLLKIAKALGSDFQDYILNELC